MKMGFVTAEFSKFSISGAPRTGKSSFLKLLYNDEPSDNDNVHNSTNVVVPRPAHVTTAIKGVDHNLLWMKVEPDKVKEIIAGNIKNHMEISPELESQQSIEHPVATESHQPLQDIDTNNSKLTPTIEDGTKSNVSQQIIELLPHVQVSKELYKAHWIYGIDTGGQAAFIDISPALLRYNSVNIYTHKLDERLNDKATFFFSVQGNQISEPMERQITNLQLLQASFRSLTSVIPPVISESANNENNAQKPHCIVLGTYYDKVLMPGYSGESLIMKNSILWSKKAEIPIRWFLFQLELDQKFCQSNIFVVRKCKCQDIGKSLEMKSDDVEAALMYYHNLTVFLYFPDILPNVVFLHSQPLFDILSDLISLSFPETVDYFKFHCIKGMNIVPRVYRELKDEGCFTKDLLSLPIFNKFSHDFTVDNFLHLMTSSLIIAYLPKEEKYFIPTVLPTTPSMNYVSIPSAFKQHVDPLILSWKMKPFPRGIFPALVVNLLYPENKLAFYLKRPLNSTPRYRNIITLHTNNGDVLLVDGICWIAVYYSDPCKRCSIIRDVVHAGICEVINNFQYMANLVNIKEFFFCFSCSNKSTEHFCQLKKDKKTLVCYESSTLMLLIKLVSNLGFP